MDELMRPFGKLSSAVECGTAARRPKCSAYVRDSRSRQEEKTKTTLSTRVACQDQRAEWVPTQ